MLGGYPRSPWIHSLEEYDRYAQGAYNLFLKSCIHSATDDELEELDRLVELLCEFETR